MGDHSESLYLHLHKQINDETCLSEMFNSERRLDLFANNYSMISTYYDQMENDPTSEQALTKWSFLDFTLAICRNLTKLHADSVPLTESETKLSLSCATCLIKSGSELHYETMIDTLINKSNFAFLVSSIHFS